MEKAGIRKRLSRVSPPIAAAAVCAVSAGILAVWFFLGFPRTAQPSEASRELSGARQIVALTGYDHRGEIISQGWGFYAFSDNVIVTTFQTIDYCRKMTLSDGDGTLRVLAYDTEQNLAILKLSGTPEGAALPWGSSEALQPGDTLTAVGNVPGTAGTFTERAQRGALLWASSASVEQGAPLLDENGQVVGMVAGPSENGLTPAIPMESIRALFFQSETETTLASLCDALHPGLKQLWGSVPVEFWELVSDPERYEGQCVRLIGRAVSTEEYTATARESRIFLMPPGSPVPEKEPTVSPWEGMDLEGYFMYWFFTPFSDSRLLRCFDGTHTLKTARYQGTDMLVCGNFHYEADGGYAALELVYTDTPRALEILFPGG